MRILLAEDEIALSKAIVTLLKHNNITVDAVYNGQDAVDCAACELYDCAVLDIMMPVKDGLTALKEIRASGKNIPIIMLTAKSQLEDKLSGLDSGADDYVTKPFEARELVARIRAAVRRKDAAAESVLYFGDLSLDTGRYELGVGASSVRLGHKEYQIMEMLMAAKGRIISAEQIMEKIWDIESNAELNVVWVYISGLRKKLQSLKAHVAIKATRNIGYSLEKTDDKKTEA